MYIYIYICMHGLYISMQVQITKTYRVHGNCLGVSFFVENTCFHAVQTNQPESRWHIRHVIWKQRCLERMFAEARPVPWRVSTPLYDTSALKFRGPLMFVLNHSAWKVPQCAKPFDPSIGRIWRTLKSRYFGSYSCGSDWKSTNWNWNGSVMFHHFPQCSIQPYVE